MTSYREIYIQKQVKALRDNPKIVALWESGSAATGSTDQYSDLDLHALCACETDEAFDLIESVMPHITHRYVEPEGPVLRHRIYFHNGAPKHFVADVGVLPVDARETLKERMVVERHGMPVVFFDDKGLIKPHPVNKIEWKARLENRVKELEDTLPIYVLQVLKPLDRHHYTEAFAFYYHGLLRKLVELLGIRYRPYRYDFELRYLERDFPEKEQAFIHESMKYVDPGDLRDKVALIDKKFRKNLAVIKDQGVLLP